MLATVENPAIRWLPAAAAGRRAIDASLTELVHDLLLHLAHPEALNFRRVSDRNWIYCFDMRTTNRPRPTHAGFRLHQPCAGVYELRAGPKAGGLAHSATLTGKRTLAGGRF
jgi:hypothetical protein